MRIIHIDNKVCVTPLKYIAVALSHSVHNHYSANKLVGFFVLNQLDSEIRVFINIRVIVLCGWVGENASEDALHEKQVDWAPLFLKNEPSQINV